MMEEIELKGVFHLFLFEEPACASCQKKIEGNEEVYVKLIYPKKRGMTEGEGLAEE